MKYLKLTYHVVLYLIFFILIGIAVSKYNLINIFCQTKLSDLSNLTLLGLIIIWILSFQLWIILRIFSIRISHFTSWALSSMNSLFNYVLPAKSGTVFKGIILKNRYGLLYANYISLLFITNLAVVLSGFILFLFFALTYNHISTRGVVTIMSTVFFIISFMYLFETKKLKIKLPIQLGYINKIYDGIRICLNNKRKISIILILNYIVICISALRLYWCFIYLGGSIKFHQVLYIQILTTFSFIFSVTPANLFVREGIIIAVGNVFSLSGELLIAAALIDRAASIASIIIASIISLPKYKAELRFGDRNTH